MFDDSALLPPARHQKNPLPASAYSQYDAVLQLTAAGEAAPYDDWFAAQARRRRPPKKDEALQTVIDGGTAVCRLPPAAAEADAFTRQQSIRAALKPLLDGAPRTLAVDARCRDDAETAIYTALVAAARLPGAVPAEKPPRLTFAGAGAGERATAAARANTLTRALVQLPPNVLTPAAFAQQARRLAAARGVGVTVYNAAQLKKLGAGAMLAVGAASTHAPRLLRLSYNPRVKNRIALVGKGVCYDTGGVNVKPARYMRGMGKDMAGAAVALASVLAAAERRLPHGIDAWLALADNAIAASAYRPDEVITAANGKRIEVVHSDAEGRMLLADALALASRRKPAAIVTYATLTGTMHVALGEGMSGFFATDEAWRAHALAAADQSGERLCRFPMPADYKDKLKSEVADIKQCSEEGEADHILAALFLREFISGQPAWLHVDLSAAVCKGGLAAAPGDITGFGAHWTQALLDRAAP